MLALVLRCLTTVCGIILDNQVLYLCQFVGYTLVVMFVFLIQTGILVLNMRANLVDELIVASENQHRYLAATVCRIDSFEHTSSQTRQAKIQKVRMGVLQIALESVQVNICR